MKVTIESLSPKEYIQINPEQAHRGSPAIVLAGAESTKEFATHGEFKPYFAPASALAAQGKIKISYEGQEAKAAAPAPQKAPEVKLEEAPVQAPVETEIKLDAHEESESDEAPAKKVNKFAPKNKQ